MASSRMPRLVACVARVWRSWWGVDIDASGSSDAADDAPDGVPVERPAMIGDEPVVVAHRLGLFCGPACEQIDEIRVQWHVAIVAELSERDAKPVVHSDQHDRVGGEVAEFAGA